LLVGISFLPANLIMAVFSLGLSAKMVLRFGIKKPLAGGLLLAALGLLLFVRVPVHGTLVDVMPSMVLLGVGAGMAFNPMLLAAMNDVPQNESGLASGIVNTSFMMGGSLGLAILASVAAFQTTSLLSVGGSPLDSLTGGYHAAFLVGSIFAGLAALLSATMLRVARG
jgi:sugar phosphate permease